MNARPLPCLPFAAAAPLAAIVLLASACADRNTSADQEPLSDSVQQTRRANSNDTIDVFLDEFTINMPSVLAAGTTFLRVTNEGFEEHDLQFTAVNADTPMWRLEKRLGPEEALVASLELEAGSYTAICDFAGHQGRGMFVDFIVR